ncbi:hypothetical protein [Oceaniglobus roseus]|uniref:hypothetical protein n=1 Tax=Oceaniglobus roseus TaxID=1737570 RepID=UPI000C7EF12D|nr:hypothetical protein [Kandeliimicrobium roseum]
MKSDPADRGALNLLRHAAGLRRGERLLIAFEPPEHGYFEPGVTARVAKAARDLGATVDLFDTGFAPEIRRLPPALADRMRAADITVFLSRLGDQLRFAGLPEGRIVVCFALSEAMLGSAFGTADPRAFSALKRLIDRHLGAARSVRVTCPRGTDFSGRPDTTPTTTAASDVRCRRFPVSVFSPVPAAGFSGRIALPGFLCGTGSRYYPRQTVRFEGPLAARFLAGRLTGFEGTPGDVDRAERQYDRIAALYGLDRNAIHSWHAGIHPACAFPWPARGRMEQWSGSAFGNPRVLHFHSCGAEAPGEICLNVIDPTVWIDGVPVWEDGVLHPARLPGGAELLERCPDMAALFRRPDFRIGLDRRGERMQPAHAVARAW